MEKPAMKYGTHNLRMGRVVGAAALLLTLTATSSAAVAIWATDSTNEVNRLQNELTLLRQDLTNLANYECAHKHAQTALSDTFSTFDISNIVDSHGVIINEPDLMQMTSVRVAPIAEALLKQVEVEYVSQEAEETKPYTCLGVVSQTAEEGVVLNRVVDGTGAWRAGLLVNDVIVALDGVSIPSHEMLKKVVVAKSPGDPVIITLKRDDSTMEVRAILGQWPMKESSATQAVPQQSRVILRSGDSTISDR
jgi:C-terminal processing protease CtpA/Prc